MSQPRGPEGDSERHPDDPPHYPYVGGMSWGTSADAHSDQSGAQADVPGEQPAAPGVPPYQPSAPTYAPGAPVYPPSGRPAPYAPMASGPYTRPWDGVSIAALVTGLLLMPPAALVLGSLGLGRTRRGVRKGRAMAVAGLALGTLQLVLLVAYVVPAIQRSFEASGIDWSLAEEESSETAETAETEEPGETGEPEEPGGVGEDSDDGAQADPDEDDWSLPWGEPDDYGDDPALDRLWDACEDGDMLACDELYEESPWGSQYEEFADTCGGRTEGGTWCEEEAPSRA